LAIGNRNIIAALQSLEATSFPQLKQHASSLLKRINNSEIIDETHFWNEVRILKIYDEVTQEMNNQMGSSTLLIRENNSLQTFMVKGNQQSMEKDSKTRLLYSTFCSSQPQTATHSRLTSRQTLQSPLVQRHFDRLDYQRIHKSTDKLTPRAKQLFHSQRPYPHSLPPISSIPPRQYPYPLIKDIDVFAMMDGERKGARKKWSGRVEGGSGGGGFLCGVAENRTRNSMLKPKVL